MNKTDLIDEVAKTAKSRKEAQAAVESILTNITAALKKGESVSLVGFGTFKVQERKARSGRNPQTGQAITISAKKVPQFAAGKALKEAVAESE